MADIRKRQTAHKVWIKDLLANKFVKQEGWDPNYVEIDGQRVSRVNVLATVVGKFLSDDGNYGALTLDDGTETIRAKTFGPDVAKMKDVEVGNLLSFVGKPKEYNEEIYLAPEVIRIEDDPNWILVRKLELGKPDENKIEKKAERGRENAGETIAFDIKESPNAKLIELIKSEDKGEGADIAKIIKKSGMDELDVRNLLAGLLKSGDMFEPKKGKLKLLE